MQRSPERELSPQKSYFKIWHKITTSSTHKTCFSFLNNEFNHCNIRTCICNDTLSFLSKGKFPHIDKPGYHIMFSKQEKFRYFINIYLINIEHIDYLLENECFDFFFSWIEVSIKKRTSCCSSCGLAMKNDMQNFWQIEKFLKKVFQTVAYNIYHRYSISLHLIKLWLIDF